LIRFVAVVLAVGVCALLITLLSVNLGWIESAPSYYVQSLLILGIFTVVIYRYLDRLKNPEIFVQIYLLSMMVKLIAYGVYVVLMIIDDKGGANQNVVFFLILYVLFTALEVGFLHRKIARNRPR
jgi:hypothetical protein